MANKKHVKLKTPRDVIRLLSKLINQLLRGEVDPEIARDVGYLSKILLDSLEKTELQEEIERIKERLGIKNESEKGIDSH